MIIIKIHNVFNLADAQPVIDVIKEFNEDKSAIWVPKEWASVEGVGDFCIEYQKTNKARKHQAVSARCI